MDRGTRTFVVVAAAVTTATVASASMYRAVRRIPVREVEVAHTYVVLAARPMPIGTRLTGDDLKLVGWPSKTPLAGAFRRIDDAVDRGLVTPVAENEPITDAKLAPRQAGAGLSPAIPTGMRAISVKVNEVIGVAGFVVPGTRVDVVATVRRQEDTRARIIVSNIQVFTAGTRYDQEKVKDARPIPSTVVTLIVTPGQAEKIALASAEGQVTLMLRNPLDVAETPTAGASLGRLVDDQPPHDAAPAAPPRPAARAMTPRVVVAEAPKPAAAEPPVYKVEAIRGGKRTEEIVRW
ncbi:MAG TPA: Flp pilus assembly protein CpaB [Vicinamibacterales bacterium]|nr:Flp pilus assembly protein CpaB [Vicinamibacterales bacterium]